MEKEGKGGERKMRGIDGKGTEYTREKVKERE